MLATLWEVLQERDATRAPPEAVRRHLWGAWLVAQRRAAAMRWELRCLAQEVPALDGALPVLLKGVAYIVRDLPRALRLRGLGGQIAVDLAPLMKKDRRQAEQVAKAALKADPVETTFVGWTPLGHVEMQRRRERVPIDAALLEAAR
jgi:hypothetical protein